MAPAGDVDISSIDFYELLSIPATSSESEIRRAYRKTSRLYHPDKVTPTPETLDKFQQLQRALEVLTDAVEKAKYDSGREAKQRRAAENAALESRRRKMKEDLENREASAPVSNVNGVKRTWSDRELAIQRIAEENRKRKEAMVARRAEEIKQAEVIPETTDDPLTRSVKVRWIKVGEGFDIDEGALEDMFPAGEVENVVILKDKKRRMEGRDKKVLMGTAVLVFKSLATAKKVVAGGAREELESVAWASEKEKDTDPT